MVCWSSFSNCWKLGIRYSNFLVMFNFHQILEYLSGSVHICTYSQRNFFQSSIERRVHLVQHFLINKYLNFKLYLRIVKFRQILEYLSGSVRICADSQGVLNMGIRCRIQSILVFVSKRSKVQKIAFLSKFMLSKNLLLLKSI